MANFVLLRYTTLNRYHEMQLTFVEAELGFLTRFRFSITAPLDLQWKTAKTRTVSRHKAMKPWIEVRKHRTGRLVTAVQHTRILISQRYSGLAMQKAINQLLIEALTDEVYLAISL